MSKLQRAALGVIAAALFVSQALPARADTSAAEAFGRGVVAPANGLLKQFEAERREAQPRSHPQRVQSDNDPIVDPNGERDRVAQTTIGGPNAPVSNPQLPGPRGWDYGFDVSSAWSAGKTGALPAFGSVGGVDGILAYRFSRFQRASGSYYELQDYPVGFSNGVVPVYLQGVATPIATQDLAAPPGPLNAAVKNKLFVASFNNMFIIAKKIPIVVSPTYTSRWGTIGGGTDLLPIEIDGFPYTVHFRTAQYMQLAFTLPFLSTPKLFATYTVAPQWLTGLNGANVTNKAQLIHLLYAEYNPLKQLTLFFEPSLYPNYLPTDKSPQHFATFIYGANFKPSPRTFIQGVFSMGGAMNLRPYGITSLTCQQLPCTSASQVVPSIGGLHAAQFQLKFGIGSPPIIPL